MPREKIEIPGDWHGRDRHLHALAMACGFQSVNRLLSHLAYEASHCRSPAIFYRALSEFYEHAHRKKQ